RREPPTDGSEPAPAHWLHRSVEVVVDRPLGSTHPSHPDLVYPVNYGHVPGTRAPDGAEIDVYLLGAEEPVERCIATVIAIVRRRDDVEDKLVAAVEGEWTVRAITDATLFQEQWFDSDVEMPP